MHPDARSVPTGTALGPNNGEEFYKELLAKHSTETSTIKGPGFLLSVFSATILPSTHEACCNPSLYKRGFLKPEAPYTRGARRGDVSTVSLSS